MFGNSNGRNNGMATISFLFHDSGYVSVKGTVRTGGVSTAANALFISLR